MGVSKNWEPPDHHKDHNGPLFMETSKLHHKDHNGPLFMETSKLPGRGIRPMYPYLGPTMELQGLSARPGEELHHTLFRQAAISGDT